MSRYKNYFKSLYHLILFLIIKYNFLFWIFKQKFYSEYLLWANEEMP